MENAQPVAENKITEDVGYKLAEKLLKMLNGPQSLANLHQEFEKFLGHILNT